MSRWRGGADRHHDIPLTRKTPEQVAMMAAAAAAARRVLDNAVNAAVIGATTRAINDAAVRELQRLGAHGLFRGYCQRGSPPFPADVCVSVNDEAVHGIPGSRVLAPGDAVSIDVGLRLDGWCADMARTIVLPPVGIDPSAPLMRRADALGALVGAARRTLEVAAGTIAPGVRWSAVAGSMERVAAEGGYGVVVEFVGHGIGRQLHEPPQAPAAWTGYAGKDFTLAEGMVLAVEPMLTLRIGDQGQGIRWDAGASPHRTAVSVGSDGWTVRTGDGSIVAHEEAVIAVTEGGALVLGADL